MLAYAFSPEGKRVLTGTESGTVHLWEVETGKIVRVLKGPHGLGQYCSLER